MKNPFSFIASLFQNNVVRVLSQRSRDSSLSSHLGTKRFPQPDFLCDEEPLAQYRLGGYHPTNIGDVLNERYVISRKLGWGNYSTVWLARDKITDSYCSIKILTGMATVSPKFHELEFLQHTTNYDPTHPGYSRIIHLLDNFKHEGPYGIHACFVTEVLCESVRSLAAYATGNNIQTAVAKGITRQVLQGLDYLHKSGIVHTDLKLDNFLLELDDMNAYVHHTLESTPPVTYPEVQGEDGRVIKYVASMPLPIPFDDVKSFKPLKVKIVDLGVACWESQTKEYFMDRAQPLALRAPEIHIGAGWDSKCDIWSLGLLLLQMLRGRSVIPVLATDQHEHEGTIASNVMFLTHYFGDFPVDLLERGKYSAKYFKPDGSFIFNKPTQVAQLPRTWKEFLNGFKGVLHPDELANLTSFLEETLRLRPEDRPTAAELLKHEWINSETRFLER